MEDVNFACTPNVHCKQIADITDAGATGGTLCKYYYIYCKYSKIDGERCQRRHVVTGLNDGEDRQQQQNS